MACPVLSACPFFADRITNMPSTAELLKRRYCWADYERCARWAVRQKLGKETVPRDLFPHETARAEAIFARHQ
jgi:hypothetical protein